MVEERNDWFSMVEERGEDWHQKEALILKGRKKVLFKLFTGLGKSIVENVHRDNLITLHHNEGTKLHRVRLYHASCIKMIFANRQSSGRCDPDSTWFSMRGKDGQDWDT